MKDKMNAKLNQRMVPEMATSLDQQPASDLDAFNKLPLNKVSPAT